MRNEIITKLEARGFNRWQKGTMDRLYINAKDLGLVCEYYNTGNIRNAYFNGERISNSEARRMTGSKTFIDVATEKIYSDNQTLKEAVEAIFAEIEEA